MIEALKKADAKILEVDFFLDTLHAEHDAARARAQLKTRWIAHARAQRAVLQEDDGAQPVAPGAGGAGVRDRAPTPPETHWQRARWGLTPGVQPETSHAYVVDCG